MEQIAAVCSDIPYRGTLKHLPGREYMNKKRGDSASLCIKSRRQLQEVEKHWFHARLGYMCYIQPAAIHAPRSKKFAGYS